MRILAIAQKVFRELIRDKRTIGLMFVAPILIMWLMNTAFSANTKTEVNLATVGVETKIVETMKNLDNVSVNSYEDKSKAEYDLSQEKVDAIIESKGDNIYDLVYSNRDASKTAISKQVFSGSLTKAEVEKVVEGVKQVAKANPSLAKNLSQDKQEPTINEIYNYGDENTGFITKMIPVLMGFIVFFFVFLVSGMALLKERTTGTLDRLLATPVKRSDIIFGYMLSYGVIAVLQTLVIVTATIYLLNIQVVGSVANVILVNFILAVVALSFGLLMSTLAKSEFQMMQFLPVIVMPQLFFSGLIPLESMPGWVQSLAKVLPLSYSGNALSKVILWGRGLIDVSNDLLMLIAFVVVLTVLNIICLKRYRKV